MGIIRGCLFDLIQNNDMLSVLIRTASMSIHNIHFHNKIRQCP